jgi:membrane-associated phospholipid phosphatase
MAITMKRAIGHLAALGVPLIGTTPRLRFLVLGTACAMLFLVLGVFADERAAFPFDVALQHLVQAARHASLEKVMREISGLGSVYFLVPVNIVAMLLIRPGGARLAVFLPAVTLGAVPVELVGKWLVGRPRPNLIAYGFPSGHVFVSCVFFGALLYVLWQLEPEAPWRRIGTLFCAVAVAAIGYSRLYVNAHWPSDVLGGLVGGLAYLLFVLAALDGRLRASTPLPGRVRPLTRN